MKNPTSKNSVLKKIGLAAAALLGCGLIGGLIWWYGPANAANRYQRMSLLDLNQVLSRNPKDALAARTLALRLARAGDMGMGEPALLTALDLNPNDPEVATALGDLWIAKKRYPEAFQVLKAVTARSPHYLLGRSELGSLYMKKGSYLHASEEYEAIVTQDKSADDAWYQLAICYLQMQQSAKAQNAIDNAIRLKPQIAHYLALKGSIDVAVGNVDKGIEDTRRAAQLAPKSTHILSTLVNLLLAQHRNDADLDLAEQAIGRLEQLDPDLPLLPFQRGELERLRQHWQAASRYLERALVLTPTQDEVYFSLGQVYRRLNRTQDADRMTHIFQRRQGLSQKMEALRIDLSSHPDKIDLYAQIADLQMQLGDREGALNTVRSGLALDPKNAALQRWTPLLSKANSSGAAPNP